MTAEPTPKPKPRPRRARRRFDPSWGSLIAAGLVLVVGAMLFLGGRNSSSGGAVKAREAPPFTLASTAGGNVSLSDFRGHNVLLYFNEGVGCDACFGQTLELQNDLGEFRAADVTILPIVVNPMSQVKGYLDQWGITIPYLIDGDGAVSKEYGMLGKGMHANLPGHGFVFVDASGRIRWEKEYPSMYASTSEIMSAIRPYLG